MELQRKFKYDETTFIAVGSVFSSKHTGDYEIVSTEHCNKVGIRFLSTGREYFVQGSHIRANSVRDSYYPSVQGIGYVGNGKYSTKAKKMYKTWTHMFERSYCDKYHKSFLHIKVVV